MAIIRSLEWSWGIFTRAMTSSIVTEILRLIAPSHVFENAQCLLRTGAERSESFGLAGLSGSGNEQTQVFLCVQYLRLEHRTRMRAMSSHALLSHLPVRSLKLEPPV